MTTADGPRRQVPEGYAARLPARIAQLEAEWIAVEAGGWEPERLRGLHCLAHSLAGSSATFGYLALADVARRIERLAQVRLDPAAACRTDEASSFATLVAALRPASIRPDGPSLIDQVQSRARSDERPRGDETTRRAVYVVDGDEARAADLAQQLQRFGYEARALGDLAAFACAVEQHPPAAVVIDLARLETEGCEGTTRGELARESTRSVPRVFVSSDSGLDARLRAVRAGGRAYVTRPIDVGTLVDKLDALTALQAPEPYRVLVVDDEPELADYHASILRDAGMIARVVTDPTHLLDAVSEFDPELVLLDVYMPGYHGPDLAAALRQDDSHIGMPIVYLSSEADPDRQLAALGLGGDGFLAKPIRPERLVAAVTARAQRARHVQGFMVRDGLTGLLNHTHLKAQLAIELTRARRQAAPVAFALIDVDLFKTVNDTYGHAAGDRVLQGIARILRQRLRRTDVIGRYGGEEFAVVLTNTDGATATRVLDQIRAAFAEIRHQADGVEFHVTFSAGVVASRGQLDPAVVSAAADRALYDAKRAGRNRIVLAAGPEAVNASGVFPASRPSQSDAPGEAREAGAADEGRRSRP